MPKIIGRASFENKSLVRDLARSNSWCKQKSSLAIPLHRLQSSFQQIKGRPLLRVMQSEFDIRKRYRHEKLLYSLSTASTIRILETVSGFNERLCTACDKLHCATASSDEESQVLSRDPTCMKFGGSLARKFEF